MKKYLLFCGANFYASGGWRDFQNSFDSLEDAMMAEKFWYASHDKAKEEPIASDWWHIVNGETGEIVYRHKGSYSG